MKIIVDVNVVLSSLLTKGDSSKVFSLNFISSKFDLISPEFFIIELEKHKKEFFNRSKLSKEEFDETLKFILEQITFIPKADFSEFLPQAKKLLDEDLKDVQYVALALKFNCPIFSGDKKLKNSLETSSIKVLSPKEMLNLL